MSKQKPMGFTLIELLVVISVVVLLIALLLPALKGARESALRVVCLSNVRQLLLGVEYYVDSYKQVYSPWGYSTALSVAQITYPEGNRQWQSLLHGPGFAPDKDGFRCPSHADFLYEDAGGRLSYAYVVGSTAMNRGDDWGGPALRVSVTYVTEQITTRANIESPHDTMVLGESVYSGRIDHGTYPMPTNTTRRFADRHDGGGSVAWSDGHATYQKQEDVYAPPGTGVHANPGWWTRWKD